MCINTFHFLSSAADPVDDAALAVGRMEDFYQAIEEMLSTELAGTGTVKVYDLVDGTPRSPILTDTISFSGSSGEALPNECAMVMSYNAAGGSGTVAARRRGRIYVGPLLATILVGGTGDVFFGATATELMRDSGLALMAANISSSLKWAVFSPTTAGPEPWSSGELASATFEVVAGHVDNAVDTVRSRGLAANARSSWT